jgi:hypothetical protein
MPNWIILTGDDIRLLDTETTIMQGIAPLQDLDSCVQSASNLARGYVAGGGNIVEAAPSVPPECKDDVLAIGRYNYLAQEPTGTLITPVRQKEFDAAMAHLRDIAKSLTAITQASVPDTSRQFGQWGSVQQFDMRTDPTTTVPGTPPNP